MRDSEGIAALLEAHQLGALRSLELLAFSHRARTYRANQQLIVRLSNPERVSHFRKAAHLYELVRQRALLPVPEVLALDLRRILLPADALILRWLPGQRGSEVWASFDLEVQYALSYDLGRALSTLHSISLPSYGDFHPDFGRLGGCLSWPECMYDRGAEILIRLWHNRVLHEQLLERAEQYLRLASIAPSNSAGAVLTHGDFGLSHVLLSNDDGEGWRLSGVIDFERALAAPAEYEFANGLLSDYDNPQPIAEPFLEGYRSLRPLDERWQQHTVPYRLVCALERIDELSGAGVPLENIQYYIDHVETILHVRKY